MTINLNYLLTRKDFTTSLNNTLNEIVAGEGFLWTEVTGPQALTTNNGYVTNNSSLVTLTLPVTAAFGG